MERQHVIADLAAKLVSTFEDHVGTELLALLKRHEYVEMRLRLKYSTEEFESIKRATQDDWNLAWERFYAHFFQLTSS